LRYCYCARGSPWGRCWACLSRAESVIDCKRVEGGAAQGPTSPPPPLRSRPSQTSLPAPPEPHSAPPFPPPRRPTPPADRERSLWYCGEPRDSLRRLDGHTLKTDAKNCSLRLRGSTERTVGAACAGRAGGERGGSGGGRNSAGEAPGGRRTSDTAPKERRAPTARRGATERIAGASCAGGAGEGVGEGRGGAGGSGGGRNGAGEAPSGRERACKVVTHEQARNVAAKYCVGFRGTERDTTRSSRTVRACFRTRWPRRSQRVARRGRSLSSSWAARERREPVRNDTVAHRKGG